jgi:hypothetical protein
MSKQGLLKNRLKESPCVSQSELSHNHKAWQKNLPSYEQNFEVPVDVEKCKELALQTAVVNGLIAEAEFQSLLTHWGRGI